LPCGPPWARCATGAGSATLGTRTRLRPVTQLAPTAVRPVWVVASVWVLPLCLQGFLPTLPTHWGGVLFCPTSWDDTRDVAAGLSAGGMRCRFICDLSALDSLGQILRRTPGVASRAGIFALCGPRPFRLTVLTLVRHRNCRLLSHSKFIYTPASIHTVRLPATVASR
jgi:hypothetical protein